MDLYALEIVGGVRWTGGVELGETFRRANDYSTHPFLAAEACIEYRPSRRFAFGAIIEAARATPMLSTMSAALEASWLWY